MQILLALSIPKDSEEACRLTQLELLLVKELKISLALDKLFRTTQVVEGSSEELLLNQISINKTKHHLKALFSKEHQTTFPSKITVRVAFSELEHLKLKIKVSGRLSIMGQTSLTLLKFLQKLISTELSKALKRLNSSSKRKSKMRPSVA